jgi:protein gp37
MGFEVMRRAPQHRYQAPTQRSERLLELSQSLDRQPQIWMRVSVESEKYLCRIDDLRQYGRTRQVSVSIPCLAH